MPESMPLVSEKSIIYKSSPKFISEENYYRAEEKSLTKHEYHDGMVTPMAGAKLRHNRLASRMIFVLEDFMKKSAVKYPISTSDTKIRIEDYNKIVYPDAVVICETPQYYKNREDTITNPLLIVEVLSDSTAKFDRGLKFEYYRTLPSFKEYVIIHQERKQVTVWTKQTDGAWLPIDYLGDTAIAILHSLQNCPLELAVLYEGI